MTGIITRAFARPWGYGRSPQGVGQTVIDPKKGVREGHAGDGGSVVHLLAGEEVCPFRKAKGRYSKTIWIARNASGSV